MEVVFRSDLHIKQIGKKAREKNRIVYVGFIYLENAYDRVSRKALCRC